MRTLLVLALAVLVSLCSCASDAPAWCAEYCRATGAQAARCAPGADPASVEASCTRQLTCSRVTAVRSMPELSSCLDALTRECGTPDSCKLQFR